MSIAFKTISGATVSPRGRLSRARTRGGVFVPPRTTNEADEKFARRVHQGGEEGSEDLDAGRVKI